MIKANFNAYSTYVTDSLYQWDLNQVLRVTGLNLSVVPEVHFSNANMDKAIVRQASMENHVVSVGIPNSLLQDPLTIHAHIGIYEGSTFKVVEKVEIPVIAKERPVDYRIEDADEEIYSFKALENALKNKADSAVINARVDNIIAHNNDTEGNTELVDIRTDIRGNVHDSAGTAVREQIRPLVKLQANPNLLDWNKLTDGYLDAAGAATGKNFPHYCYYSDYIPVESGINYYWRVDHPITYGEDPWVGFCTYDANKNFIERLSWYVNERAIIFNENVAYVRISFRSLLLGNAKFEQSTYPTNIEMAPSKNLAEVFPLSIPGYINSSGNINSQTAAGDSGILLAEYFSRMIPVTEGDTYVFYNGASYDPWAAVAFYDETGTSLGRTVFTTDENDTFTVVVPEGAVAMRYSARTYSQSNFIVYKKTGYNDYLEDYVQLLIANRSKVDTTRAMVKSVAHRGYSSGAPENTLPAYRLAKLNGFECAECDISFTSDGVPVLLHDGTIDRTSDGSGNVEDMTYNALLAYDFGSWFGSEYASTTIPTLGQFLLLCRNVGLKPYIELKAGTEEQIRGLIDSVKQFGLLDATTWISFNADYLSYIKDEYSKARLGFVVNAITDDTIAIAQSLQTGENEVFIDSATYTAEEVNRCIVANIPMEVWTVNSETTIRNLPYYVSGVTSDILHAGRVLCAYSMN